MINLNKFIDEQHFYGLNEVDIMFYDLRIYVGLPPFDWEFVASIGRRFVCPGCGDRVLTCDGDTHVPICMSQYPRRFGV